MNELDFALDLGPIHVALGDINKRIKEITEKLIQDDQQFNGSVVYAANAVNYIDLGHPSTGYWWQVRSIQIGGTDITQTPAGVGWVIVQANPPTLQTPMISVSDWTKTALPASAFYGTHELTVSQNQHLFVQITGGTVGVEYVASCAVENFKEFVRSRL